MFHNSFYWHLHLSFPQLLATVILSQLRFHHGDFVKCGSMVSTAYDCLVEFINDETPIVLKSVCEAMRVCLPLLLSSSQPTRGTQVYASYYVLYAKCFFFSG